jgi:hypothetical protein
MLTVDQLKRFSNQCLKLRQTLQTGLRCNESEYLMIKSHIETLITDLEKQIESESAPEALDRPEMSAAS